MALRTSHIIPSVNIAPPCHTGIRLRRITIHYKEGSVSPLLGSFREVAVPEAFQSCYTEAGPTFLHILSTALSRPATWQAAEAAYWAAACASCQIVEDAEGGGGQVAAEAAGFMAGVFKSLPGEGKVLSPMMT